MTNYQKGDRCEKRALGELQDNGYAAWQSRVSRSPADIVAVKRGQVLFVQVKSGRKPMSHEEWNALYALAVRVGAVPVLAQRERRAITYRRLTGRHVSRSHYWPCEPFQLDEVVSDARH